MRSTALAESAPAAGLVAPGRRVFVAWQNPETREITPVAMLQRLADGEARFEFRYLRRAGDLPDFRPFIGFPDLARPYQSEELFPFFENRIVPRTREDYPEFVRSLGLGPDADPFEILARTEGRRQTDTIEVFPEPLLDQGSLCLCFLVHGIRHVPGADEAIEHLSPGAELSVMADLQNDNDVLAVMVRSADYQLLGWIPRYLTELVHTPLRELGQGALSVRVEHIGDRDGPIHLRLLCRMEARWPEGRPAPFSGPDYEPFTQSS